jgi:MFS family permease
VVSPTQSALVRRLLINRAFALLWCGQVITDLGSVVVNTAAVLWLAEHLAASLAPLAVSGVFLATALPSVVVRPFAGVLVDRRDARRTMLWMDALRALALLALTGVLMAALPSSQLAESGIVLVAALYAVLLFSAVCAQFFNPALLALIGDLVPDPAVPRATGLSEMTWNLATVLGPPCAALLLTIAGLSWVLVLDALSFAASFVTIAAIRQPMTRRDVLPARPARGSEFRRALGGGLAFVARDRVVRTIAVSLAIAVFGAGAYNALNVFFVTANLHAAPAAYGVLGGAFGVGSILGALLAGPLAVRIGLARLYSYSMIAVGVIVVVYSRLTSIGPAVVLFAIFGIPNAASNAAFAALLLRATPRDLLGRVSSAVVALYSLTSLCSYLLAGVLAASLLPPLRIVAGEFHFGPLDTLFAAIGALIVLAGIFAAVGLAHSQQSPSSA